jgi:hypothetical protein
MEDDKLLDDSYLVLWLDKEILHARFKSPEVTLDIARHTLAERMKFTEQKNYPLLVDITHVKSVTKEARELFAHKDNTRGLSASALLTSSYLSKIIGNLFLKFNKPLIPTKIVNSKEEGVKFLSSFV